MAVCAPRAHIKIRRYFPSLAICCRKVAPYFLSRATARRSTNIILYSLLFIILLSQRHFHHQHQGRIENATDGPDEPAVLGLAVALGAKGVQQECRRDHQPVHHADGGTQLTGGFAVAGVVPFFQQLFPCAAIGFPPNTKAKTPQATNTSRTQTAAFITIPLFTIMATNSGIADRMHSTVPVRFNLS